MPEPLQLISDEALAGRAQFGDDKARDELLRRYDAKCRADAALHSLVGREKDDAYQEAVLAVLQAIGGPLELRYDPSKHLSFEEHASDSIERALNRGERERKTFRSAVSLDAPLAEGGERELLDTLIGDPAEYDSKIFRDEVRRAIRMLKPERRRVLELLQENMSYRDIAKTLGIAPSTAQERAARAVVELREFLLAA